MNQKNRKLLYHPNIEPDLLWLKKALMVTDEIVRIVPADAENVDSEPFREFNDLFPEAISKIAPEERDISLNDIEVARIDKAFEMISSGSHQPRSGSIVIELPEEGGFKIKGYALLHSGKFAGKMKELLEKHGLIRSELNFLAEAAGHEGFDVVEEQASDLILSVLADKIASRRRWDTITDNSLDFTVNGLNALQQPPQTLVEGAVAECLLEIALPSSISEMSLGDYKELRHSFRDIRTLFQQCTHDIVTNENLLHVSNPQALQDIMPAVVQDFVDEMNIYRQTAFAKRLGQWSPIYFSHLSRAIALVGATTGATLDAFMPGFGTVSVALGVLAVNILGPQLISMTPKETNQERLIRRLCTLEKKAKKSLVTDLA